MIDYQLRTSARSRHVRLSVSFVSGLEIIVPPGFDTSRIPEIVARKERWIKRSIERMRLSGPPVEIPTQINLRSIGRTFHVHVDYNTKRKNRLIEQNDSLTLAVNLRNKRIPFILLRKWVHERAADVLLPWLESVSSRHGMSYNKAAVRFQRTRWGSCSSRKNINLNQALVFLRPELVEYLMIHELCHTLELNHSKRFWELVGMHCPDYRMLDRELKGARRNVERWMD